MNFLVKTAALVVFFLGGVVVWDRVEMALSRTNHTFTPDAACSTPTGVPGSNELRAAQDLDQDLARCLNSLHPSLCGPELLKEFRYVLGDGISTLQGIRDVNSTRNALPRLVDLSRTTDQLLVRVDSLPDYAKRVIAFRVRQGLLELQAADQKLSAAPEVQTVLRPVLDPWFAKLAALTDPEG